MAKKKRKVGGGGKLSRSETVTVRLDPRLKFAADLAARKHRRTLSSFIEWAIELTTKKVTLTEDWLAGGNVELSAYDAIDHVWDVDECDRFLNMAVNVPELFTHEEEVLFKLIRTTRLLWKKELTWSKKNRGWDINLEDIYVDRVRLLWGTLKQVSRGELKEDDISAVFEALIDP